LFNPKKKTFSRCNFKLSVKSGPIFTGSHLTLKKLCLFFSYYLTLSPPRSKLLMEELDISSHTYNDWASFCREVKVVSELLLQK
jgi:hypothetical protein